MERPSDSITSLLMLPVARALVISEHRDGAQ